MGLIASLNRPGGNVTGVNILTSELAAKRVGLLRDLVPSSAVIAYIVNPNFPSTPAGIRDVQAAAPALGVQIVVMPATSIADIDAAFVSMRDKQIGALLVGADSFFNSRRDQFVALSARHSIPAIYELREFAVAGGLLSYGTNLADAYRQMGRYAGRILRGEKAGDLPFVQSAKFELVINATTAKALGVRLPSGLLSIADEVIE